MELILWFLVGYLFGSFPTGYVISRLKGKDITKLGSGNIGAANVFRVFGAKYAFLTAIGDVLKGFIPTVLAPGIIPALAAAFGALTGSVASVFLKFRGGKGFATLVGAALALLSITNHWEVFPILLTPWISTVVFSRYTSLANIVTILTAVPVAACVGSLPLLSFFTFASVIILYSHRENVRRLLEGRERSFLEKVKGNERW